MKLRLKKAFSLIELSIVILVIGILIAGVLQGSKMYNAFKLQTARSLTISSPVAGIKDLMLWYETSLESSFKTTEAVDGTAVTTWYDNNPQTITKNNATQSTTSQKPKFYENVLNGIPVIRFDGSNDYLQYDGTFLANTNYTIFIVEQRRVGGVNYVIGGTGFSTNQNLYFGYDNAGGTSIIFNHYNGSISFSVPAYSEPIPRMHTLWFSKTTGKRYWFNGGRSSDAQYSGDTNALTSYAGAMIGRHLVCCNYYNGDIAEFIIYTHDLTTEERQSVEDYLSKKYAIAIVQ
jgi:prepilin-type N-terminal cleavage/methylation domain-containing protein